MSAVPIQMEDKFFYPVFEQQIAAGATELELRISHSSISNTYPSCARKFEFGKLFLYDRYSEDDDNFAGDVGKALHVSYQDYFVNQDVDKAVAELMFAYPAKICDNPMDNRSIESCYGTLMNMINMPGMENYEIANVKCPDGEIRPGVEVPFEIRFRNLQLQYHGYPIIVIYTGYIDLVVWDRISGEYSVIDIKTTRNNAGDKTALYKFDEQSLPYGLVVSQIVGQTIEEMEVHYLSVFVDPVEPSSRLYTFKKKQHDLRDWAQTIEQRLQQLQWGLNKHWFPKTGRSCMNFKRPCKYFEVCHYRKPETIINFMDTNEKHSEQVEIEPWIKIDLEIAA